jgi:hypothetical protein
MPSIQIGNIISFTVRVIRRKELPCQNATWQMMRNFPEGKAAAGRRGDRSRISAERKQALTIQEP